MKSIFKIITIFSFLCCVISCKTRQDVVYLQDLPRDTQIEMASKYASVLQPDDLLAIYVSNKDNAGTGIFNTTAMDTSIPGIDRLGVSSRMKQLTYMVQQDGAIDFPGLGRIKVAGLTTNELISMLKSKLSTYIKDPIVTIEWVNFRYSVLGQVQRPGVFNSQSQKVTLLEALGQAGDLTIYGSRTDVLLIRQENGVQTYKNIDLTKKDFLTSDAFYIKQNDVIIVAPNRFQIQTGSGLATNVSLFTAIATTAISAALLIVQLFK